MSPKFQTCISKDWVVGFIKRHDLCTCKTAMVQCLQIKDLEEKTDSFQKLIFEKWEEDKLDAKLIINMDETPILRPCNSKNCWWILSEKCVYMVCQVWRKAVDAHVDLWHLSQVHQRQVPLDSWLFLQPSDRQFHEDIENGKHGNGSNAWWSHMWQPLDISINNFASQWVALSEKHLKWDKIRVRGSKEPLKKLYNGLKSSELSFRNTCKQGVWCKRQSQQQWGQRDLKWTSLRRIINHWQTVWKWSVWGPWYSCLFARAEDWIFMWITDS